MRREAGDILTLECDLARVWLVEPTHDIHQGRLARTVGAHQAHDLTGRQFETHVIDGDQPSERLFHSTN